jgi:diamine N-acetyltransferase
MKLRGPRVTIRPMVRGDLDAMMNWRPFVDPIYQPYDFPRRTKTENVHWYEWRSRDPYRRLYVVENEKHEVIGSLTLREINKQESARLGITIGADFVSQGYGSEAMRVFFDYYFETMGFEQLDLDVAATNLRAVRAYRTLGFRYVGHHYRLANHPSYDTLRKEPQYRHFRRFFRRRGTAYEVLFYDMVLTRQEWQEQQHPPDKPVEA